MDTLELTNFYAREVLRQHVITGRVLTGVEVGHIADPTVSDESARNIGRTISRYMGDVAPDARTSLELALGLGVSREVYRRWEEAARKTRSEKETTLDPTASYLGVGGHDVWFGLSSGYESSRL